MGLGEGREGEGEALTSLVTSTMGKCCGAPGGQWLGEVVYGEGGGGEVGR